MTTTSPRRIRPCGSTIAGLPKEAARLLVRHYRIDRAHSNAFAAWQRMGSPQQPTSDQYRELEAAGQLELLESPRWVQTKAGVVAAPVRPAPAGPVAGTGELVAGRWRAC